MNVPLINSAGKWLTRDGLPIVGDEPCPECCLRCDDEGFVMPDISFTSQNIVICACLQRTSDGGSFSVADVGINGFAAPMDPPGSSIDFPTSYVYDQLILVPLSTG